MPEKIPLGESSQINVYILIPILALFFNENNVFICISSLCVSTNLACENLIFHTIYLLLSFQPVIVFVHDCFSPDFSQFSVLILKYALRRSPSLLLSVLLPLSRGAGSPGIHMPSWCHFPLLLLYNARRLSTSRSWPCPDSSTHLLRCPLKVHGFQKFCVRLRYCKMT